EGGGGPGGSVGQGDTSLDGMREKAQHVMGTMQTRLKALGGDWSRVTAIEVYTAQPIHGLLDDILRPAAAAAIHGLRWFPSRPPVQGLAVEMGLRGVGPEPVI